MQDLPPALTISAIRADGLGLSQAVFLAVKGPAEPYLVGGAKISKVKEKRSHRSLLLRGRHTWNSPVAYGGEQGSRAQVYRWCSAGDRAEILVGGGRWEGLSLYRVEGGKRYDVQPVRPPEEIEPR